MKRNIDPVIIDYFKTRKPYTYAHLIKFERPIVASQNIDTSEKQFVYLTDASTDQYFNDPRLDSSTANLSTKYRANRVLEIPPISEYSTARATAIDLRLDASALGAYLADNVVITSAGTDQWTLAFDFPVYDKGFVEGDKIRLEAAGNLYTLEVIGFPEDNVLKVRKIEGVLPTGTLDVYIDLVSEELISILQNKNSTEYASFINREVIIYKVFYDEDNKQLGNPYYLYKGIIQDVSLEDNESTIMVNWTLNSHWGDFSEVRGRITSDEHHRALDQRGIPQPESAIKPVYAYDKGFMHADTAVHIEATYTVQVEKQDVKYKKGFFGIGAKVKVKKYMAPEDRKTELDFQLQGKSLDVIYGVRPAEGTPIFADTKNNDSNEIYVAYSICEGEIGGIYDLIVNDKSLICNNESDFDTRSTQTEENTVEVVCYGRADRGDVLEGVTSSTNTDVSFYNTDLLTYYNEQSLSYMTNYAGFSQPLSTYSGTVGVLHENSIRLTEPIDMTLSVYCGRTNQRAAPNLVEIAKANNFKIQNDYWQGSDKMEYWGPNHRMLDTAYCVGHYTISEGETSLPNLKMVVKGAFINCYNYDNSYQHYDKAGGENPANFKLGDRVDIYSAAGVLLDSQVRIINVFRIRNNEGVLEDRFQLDKTPSLNYVDGVPGITKFYMQIGTNRWTMVTYNYVETSGTVPVKLENPVVGVTPGPSNEAVIDLGPTPVVGGSLVGSGGRLYMGAIRLEAY